MKKIKTLTNSFVLQDVDSSGKIIHQQGYKKGGLTYQIENGNIKFYLYQDYFYKNVVWSADLPLQVDDTKYDANTIADGIKKIFKFETDPADTEFNADSEMPISNAAVTNKFNAIDATISGLKKKDEQLTTEVNSKASEASVTALQGLVDTKANAGDSYTKAESDDKYALKNQVPTDVYTKSETDDKLASKADKSEIPSLDGYATEEWVNNQGYLKEHQDLSNYATKADLNKKQDVLVSGQNIKTINGQDIFGSGDITIEGNGVKKWEGTRAEYNALGTYDENTLYIITDENVEYALKSDLADKQDKGDYALKTDIPVVPTKVSSFENDKGYLTEHQDLSSYALKTEIPVVPTKVSAFENDKGYLTEHQDISGLATKTELSTKQDKGDYALKTDIPTVPSKVSAFENDKGYLTEHQDLSNYALKTDIPVVPSKVSAFENDKGYLTEHQDISNLATKTELNGKQDALVSGTNLKTINGQSLLGNGDITINGGASLPISSDNVNYSSSSSTKTLTQVLNNTETLTFTLEDGSTVTKKFILG